MGTVRALGQGGHEVAAEKMAPMPRMKHEPLPGMTGGPGMEDMATAPGATRSQIAAMTILTLIALGAGIILATVFGRLAM